MITDEIVKPTVVDGATLTTLEGMTVGLLDSVTELAPVDVNRTVIVD